MKRLWFISSISLAFLALAGCGDTTESGENSPPEAILSVQPTGEVGVGSQVSLSGSSSTDPDGDTLEFRFDVTAPDGASVLSGARGVSQTFTPQQLGDYDVSMSASDGSATSQDSATVTVIEAMNRPPMADAGEDATVVNEEPYQLDGRDSSDPDGDMLTFSWQLLRRPDSSSATLENAGQQQPTLTPDAVGEYEAELTVSDPAGETDTDTVTITVEPGNRPPVADAGDDRTVGVGDEVTVDASGSSDPDGDGLTYAWSLDSSPSGSAAALDDPSAESTTFTADVEGDYTLTLTVDDGEFDDSDEVVITATQGNRSPVADAGADQSVQVGEQVTLDGSNSSDPDGDTLIFAWAFTNDPSGGADTITDADMAIATFTPSVAGTYTAELTVTDPDGLTATDTVDIVVSDGNTPPTADAGSDQSVAVGTQVTVDASASSDAEDALADLTFAWAFSADPDGATTFADAAAQSTTFTPNSAGDYIVELTVTDTGGLTDTATVTITATSADQPPIASFTSPSAVHRATSASLDASGSSDPDGDPLSFAWSLTTDPSGADTVADTTAEQTTLTPSAVGAYDIQLDVTANGASDSASRTLYSVEPTGGPCLIVSEYVEASSNNKAVEIFNCGGSAIDLTNYRVCFSSNTTTDCSSGDVDLTGSLAAGAVQTMCNSSLDTGVYGGTCDYNSAAVNFNGNDRLLIYEDVDTSGAFNSGDTRVDAFGVTETEPAAGTWEDVRWQRCNFTTWSGATGEGLDNSTQDALYDVDSPATDADYFTDFGTAPTEGCTP